MTDSSMFGEIVINSVQTKCRLNWGGGQVMEVKFKKAFGLVWLNEEKKNA